jgi:hypothetical protein
LGNRTCHVRTLAHPYHPRAESASDTCPPVPASAPPS